nr:MAG: hypothetical protein [Microviridae sp.]
MKYLITYVDLIDNKEKIMMVIYTDEILKLEIEETDEDKSVVVQHPDGHIIDSECFNGDSDPK